MNLFLTAPAPGGTVTTVLCRVGAVVAFSHSQNSLVLGPRRPPVLDWKELLQNGCPYGYFTYGKEADLASKAGPSACGSPFRAEFLKIHFLPLRDPALPAVWVYTSVSETEKAVRKEP